MAHARDHIVTRRAESVARRRRRRQTAGLAALLVALVAAIAIVLASAGPSATHRALASPTKPALGATRAAPGHRLSSIEARGNANIRRLASLGLPVYCGGPHGNALAFTFDDGPGVYTHYAVHKLAAAHQQATFFVVGKSIEAFPGWLTRELRVGTLGDHTLTHADLLTLGSSQVTSQLETNKQLIERESGQPVDLFRPPYGAQNAAVNRIARQLGLLDILWSMDSRDSLGADWASIIKNVESDLRPGAIILMHENRGQTIRALTTLLPVLRQRHLRSVSLPQLFATDPPTPAQVRGGVTACLGHPAGSGNVASAS